MIDLFASRDIPNGRKHPTLAEKIDASGDCWEWRGKPDRDGYKPVHMNGKNHKAHRVVWEALVGPIPEGMLVDHMCRNRGCVNPDHLTIVTPKGNVETSWSYRRAVCKRNHSSNWYTDPQGRRMCRDCQKYRSDGSKRW